MSNNSNSNIQSVFFFGSVCYYSRHASSSSSCLVQAPLSLSSLSISLSRLFLPLLLPLVLHRSVMELRSEQSLSLSLSLNLPSDLGGVACVRMWPCYVCSPPHSTDCVGEEEDILTCVRILRVFSPTHAALPHTQLTTDTANMHTYLQYIYRRVYACVRASLCVRDVKYLYIIIYIINVYLCVCVCVCVCVCHGRCHGDCVCVCVCVCLCVCAMVDVMVPKENTGDTSRPLIPCLCTSSLPSPLSTPTRQSHTPPSSKAPKASCRILFERYATHYVRLRGTSSYSPPPLLPVSPPRPPICAPNASLLWTSVFLGSQLPPPRTVRGGGPHSAPRTRARTVSTYVGYICRLLAHI
jgi:hypothetical protein